MKKLLIISYLFAPIQAIGAIRWTKLAKYLTRMGVEVDVITTASLKQSDPLLARDAEGIHVIHRIPHSSPEFSVNSGGFGAVAKPPSGESKIKALIRKSPVNLLRRYINNKKSVWKGAKYDYARGKDFAEQAEEYIENNINVADYDAVVASFGPVGNTLVALWIKERYPETRLIMDFRDTMARSSTTWAVRGAYFRMQKDICEVADELVTVTDGCANEIFGRWYGTAKAHIVCNGYDPEDFVAAAAKSNEKFSFAYTGQVYIDKQRLAPIFFALARLTAEGILNIGEIEFQYAGWHGNYLRDMAEKYGMADIIIDHGVLPRGEALKLQQSSRFLALASWNSRGDEGVLTGKLFEYMMAERPIIATVTGNLADSELRRVIERGRLGVVHEQADPGSDDRLYEYLKREAIRYRQGQKAEFSPDEDYVAGFSYEELAKKVEKLI